MAEEFRMSEDESTRMQQALKKPEFRKLLAEYAQEISDPENKKKYEEELIALEKQRGVDMKYIHPKAGFVIKSFLLPESSGKIFINVCHSEVVSAATSTPSKNRKRRGEKWSIPYSLTPPREDVDKSKNKCQVVDAVFNTETLQKGKENVRFKELLVDTVFDGLRDQLKLEVDRGKVVYLRMPYKGTPTPAVIRTRTEEQGSENGGLKIPSPPLKEELEAKSHKSQQKRKEKAKLPTEPKYSVLHRGEFSIQDFTCTRESTLVKRPKELVVSIELPGVELASSVELDIFEKKIVLNSKTPPYKLDLCLPYPIDEEKGKAKFDKAKKVLTVTLPVLKAPPSQTANETGTVQSHDQSYDPVKEAVSKGTHDQSHDQSHDSTKEAEGVPQDTHTDINQSHDPAKEGVSKDTCDQSHDQSCDPAKEAEGVPKDTRIETSKESTKDTEYGGEERRGSSSELKEDSHSSPDEGTSCTVTAASLESHDLDHIPTPTPEMQGEWSSKGEWVCPPFSYRQDGAVVVFCLHTASVKRKSMVEHFDDHCVQLTYSTEDGGKYSFYACFPPDSCGLDVDDCTVDISDENIVLLLKKDLPEATSDAVSVCDTVWEKFSVGLNAGQTTEKLFLTASNVQSVIEKVDDLPDPWKKSNGWSESAVASASLVAEEGRLDIEIREQPDTEASSSELSKVHPEATPPSTTANVRPGVTPPSTTASVHPGVTPPSTTASMHPGAMPSKESEVNENENGSPEKLPDASHQLTATDQPGPLSSDLVCEAASAPAQGTVVSLEDKTKTELVPRTEETDSAFLKDGETLVAALEDLKVTPDHTPKIKLSNKLLYSLD